MKSDSKAADKACPERSRRECPPPHRRYSTLPQNIFQRFSQLRMLELVSTCGEFRRFDALAGQKQFVAHLSENEPDGEAGHREKRRAFENGSQGLGEFRIRHRSR